MPATRSVCCNRFYDGNRYDVSESLGFQMVNLMLQMRREVDLRMAAHGLTNAQWRPLWMLKTGHASTVNELSNVMAMDPGAMTRMVDRLVTKGLVLRVRSETDRRVVHLTLTEAGEAAVRHVPHVLANVNNEFLRGFSKAEWLQIRSMIARMAENGHALVTSSTADGVSV